MAIARMDHAGTLEAAMRSGINLFLGAGFSVYARDAKRRNLPVGSTLAQELVQRFGCPELSALHLDRLSDVLRKEHAVEFVQFLRERFRVASYDPLYDSILGIETAAIVTVNIDNLLNKVFLTSNSKHLHDIVVSGPTHKDTTAVDYVPLHGHVDHPDSRFDFGTVELASSAMRDPDKIHFLTERLQAKPTFYWGFAMNDSGPLLALDPAMRGGRPLKERWIALRDNDPAQIAYFQAMDFNIVVGDTADLLAFAQNVRKTRPIIVAPFAEQFRNHRVPDLSETPPRPIIEFFVGNAPTWYDIFSHRVPRTSYFGQLTNLLHEGKNVLITGMPQSGKTTLLMQLATHFDNPSPKLFVDYLSPEKANQFVNATSKDRPLTLFVDDAGSSMQGLEVALRSPNIQVAAADRNMNIDVSYHVLKGAKPTLVDVSDLTNADVGLVYRAIPDSLKRSRFSEPHV